MGPASIEWEWRVSWCHPRFGPLDQVCYSEEEAFREAALLRERYACFDVRLWRRPVEVWRPAHQAEFPGEPREAE
jgi:hypothetical protein